MIYLTEKDILKAVSIDEMLDAIEASMYIYERKEFCMPQRLHVDHKGNTLLLMPCFTKDSFGSKLVTLFPRNPENNIPVLNGIMVLNDAQTGVPLALLNGPALTAIRTAAVGAVSIRHLAAEDTQSVGIVGAGVQGFHQTWLACSARNLMDIFIFDLYPEKSLALMEKLSKVVPHVKLHQATSVEELLEESQVVITATTSLEPVLPDKEELLAGKHFVGIGSYKPNMREFPKAIFNLLKTVFIDTDHALEESGDLIVPLRNNWIKQEQVMTLGRFLIENKPHDEVKEETTLFKCGDGNSCSFCRQGLSKFQTSFTEQAAIIYMGLAHIHHLGGGVNISHSYQDAHCHLCRFALLTIQKLLIPPAQLH